MATITEILDDETEGNETNNGLQTEAQDESNDNQVDAVKE